jgi:heme-degrading monooxygenase HmoA
MYYAVIFTSIRSEIEEGYSEMAQKMVDLAQNQPGFIGMESARNEIGITISYWETLSAIQNWKNNIKHLESQEFGKSIWYKYYKVRIAKVEQEYFN